MADHTTRHWPSELYLPGKVYDRDNRENWTKAGALDAYGRAVAEVDRRLAAYVPPETDPAIEAELQRIIRVGARCRRRSCPRCRRLPDAATVAVATAAGAAPGRRHNPRRGR